MKRALARCVVHCGRSYTLSIVDISGDEIIVEPFVRETPATPFVDGTVYIVRRGTLPEEAKWPANAGEAQLVIKK